MQGASNDPETPIAFSLQIVLYNLRFAVVFQECLDPIFKVLLIGQPGGLLDDSPVLAKEETLRHETNTAIFVCRRGIAEDDQILHAARLGKFGYFVSAARLHGDSDDLDPLAAIRLIQLNEPGDLNLARSTPSPPEVHNNGLPSQSGQLEATAVDCA